MRRARARLRLPTAGQLTDEERGKLRDLWNKQTAYRAVLESAQARLALPTEPCPAERYLEHIERAIAEKAARHRVLSLGPVPGSFPRSRP